MLFGLLFRGPACVLGLPSSDFVFCFFLGGSLNFASIFWSRAWLRIYWRWRAHGPVIELQVQPLGDGKAHCPGLFKAGSIAGI